MPWWRILTTLCHLKYYELASFRHADSGCDTISSFSLHSRHLVVRGSHDLCPVGSVWSCAVMSASVSIFSPVCLSHLKTALLFVVSLICLTYCPWSGFCIQLFLVSSCVCFFHSAIALSGFFHKPLCCTAFSMCYSVLSQIFDEVSLVVFDGILNSSEASALGFSGDVEPVDTRSWV